MSCCNYSCFIIIITTCFSRWNYNGLCRIENSTSLGRSEPSAINSQIDGKTLKQFQPNKSGNTSCGTGNDSWYGKIEIDRRKVMGNPQPSSIIIYNIYGVQFID